MKTLALLLGLVAFAPAAGAKPSEAFKTTGGFFAVSVADMASSVAWYRNALGLDIVMEQQQAGIAVTALAGGGLTVELIRIDGARVGGLVSTTDGDIYVGADSRLERGILIHKRDVAGLSFGDLKLGIPIGRGTPPRVVIGPGAKVAGTLRFKRKVELLVSESATIGAVEGGPPVMFATEEPPPPAAITK